MWQPLSKSTAESRAFLLIGFCASLIAGALTFYPNRLSHYLNDSSLYYTYPLQNKAWRNLRVIGAAIDDRSLQAISPRFPWKRSVFADFLDIVSGEGAGVVGFDVVFSGESENSEDDQRLSQALENSQSQVVLAYYFDPKAMQPTLPLRSFQEKSDKVGLVNTPADEDSKVRRLRAYIDIDGRRYYSFSVALAASFLDKSPEDLLRSIPIRPDKTYCLNYVLKENDILQVSFSDILFNLQGLKKIHGKDFLRKALILVYPEAEIRHDKHLTPLGRLPGGLLHLNGFINLVSVGVLSERPELIIPFLILAFAVVYFSLNRLGFWSGLVIVIGCFFAGLWAFVALRFYDLTFDFAVFFYFLVFYFAFGSLYKYALFFSELLKIKDKATVDPFRRVLTLRYFYYRLTLELKRFYFGKNHYLVFIYSEGLREASSIAFEESKKLWEDIVTGLHARSNLWSLYAQEELAGFLICKPGQLKIAVNSLKNSVELSLIKKDIKLPVRAAVLRLQGWYPLRELMQIVSGQVRFQKDEVVLLSDEEVRLLVQRRKDSQDVGKNLLDTLGDDIEDKNRQLLSLIESLNLEHARTKEAFFQIITSLVNALEARDAYTQGHSERVSKFSLLLADALGWTAEEKEKLRKAALLHDLGKIGIPDRILHKRERLTEEEYEVIRTHEIIGVKILKPLKELQEILPWILYHHERWDGKGYPHGLAGENIPEAAQIISLADVFDALSTGRDYKPAFSIEDSLQEIIRNRGGQFNPRLVDIFVNIIRAQKDPHVV